MHDKCSFDINHLKDTSGIIINQLTIVVVIIKYQTPDGLVFIFCQTQNISHNMSKIGIVLG